MRLTLIVLVCCVSGCGLVPGNYSCDFRPKRPQCTDWRDYVGPTVTQQSLCTTIDSATGDGKWTANQKCPATDSVGGCQTETPTGKQTNWFYPPKTEAEVRDECRTDGTTFVTPS